MTTPTATPTARAALFARIAHLNGMTQTTPAEGGAVVATLHVGVGVDAVIRLAWHGDDGIMPGVVTPSHTNVNQIVDSIRSTLVRHDYPVDVEVTLDWGERVALVMVRVSARRTHEAWAITLAASSEAGEVEIMEEGLLPDGSKYTTLFDRALSTAVWAVESPDGESITLHGDDFYQNRSAAQAAKALLASLGLA